jgi:hypothetical protein
MARGDRGKTVFEADDDGLVFLKRLEEVCGSCAWRVHAWVLMGMPLPGRRRSTLRIFESIALQRALPGNKLKL